MTTLIFIVGLGIGLLLGVIVMALCFIAKDCSND